MALLLRTNLLLQRRFCSVRRLSAIRTPCCAITPRHKVNAHRCVQVRAASGSSEPDKTWSELAASAAELAKAAAAKVGRGVTDIVGTVTQQVSEKVATAREQVSTARQRTEVVDPEKEMQEQMYRRGVEIGTGVFGNNLLGRSLGGMLGNVLKDLQSSSSDNASEIMERAQQLIAADRQVLRALGGACEVGDAEEASQMSSMVNGDLVQQIEMQIPILGKNGKVAVAQVAFTEQDDVVTKFAIEVITEDGQTFDVKTDLTTAGSSTRDYVKDRGVPPAQQTIDVDWQEVK